ncbi:hypothetical protein BH09PSE6_BH09PSE6_08970 [soil metagenome]
MTFTPVSTTTAAAVLPALTQQLHRFFHHLDERRYDEMLDLFTDDCRWLRQGQWLDGKPSVRRALETRPADVETRHVMTNAFVAAADADSATVEAYMTAYRHPTGSADSVAQVAGPLRFNLTTTVFRRDAGHDWRIAEQRMVAVMSFTA